MSAMRVQHNSIAERLWYVVSEAVDAGVAPQDFKDEAVECFIEAYRERAQALVDEACKDRTGQVTQGTRILRG